MRTIQDPCSMENEARQEIVAYWMRKAAEALESAQSELGEGRLDFRSLLQRTT